MTSTLASPLTLPARPIRLLKSETRRLRRWAKDESIEAYAAERQARDAEAKGEPVDDEARSTRIRDALAKARQDTAEARAQNGLDQSLDLDAQYQTAEQDWQQAEQQEQTFEQEREQAKAEGRFTATAEMLKTANPQAHQEITNSLGALDVMMQPEQLDVLRREMVKGDPRESLMVLHRLTQPNFQEDGSVLTPEQKLSILASMPPAQLAATLDQARTYIQLESDISKQALSPICGSSPRRVSKAPPPFKSPRGGANPPVSLERLASKGEDISRLCQGQARADEAGP